MSSEPSAEENLSSKLFKLFKYIKENNTGKVGELLESSRHDENFNINMKSEAGVTLVNQVDNDGITPLALAVHLGQAEVVKILLEYKAEVNQAYMHGRTPLHIVARTGNISCIETLLKHGANVNLEDCVGNTPLHLAAYEGHKNVVKTLFHYGADVNSSEQE